MINMKQKERKESIKEKDLNRKIKEKRVRLTYTFFEVVKLATSSSVTTATTTD